MSIPEPAASARGGFLRAVIVLVSGTALAHALSALALPILSRLYSPSDFGLLAVFSGSLSIVTVAACLRYDLAVPLPESEDDALHLLALSLMCACGVAALLVGTVAVAGPQLADLLGQPALAPYLWLLPVGVLAAGGYAALQSWHIRRKHFGLLSRTRILQSASSVTVQIGLGSASAGPVGLLLGYVLNAGAACIVLGGDLLRALPRLSMGRMLTLARDYGRFPKYSTLEAVANSAAIQLPIIVIAGITEPAEAGFLSMAMYAMQVPMALFGVAIGQVYLSRAAEEYRRDSLGPFTADLMRGLIRAGTGPLIATGILAPALFGLVLGERWERAGLLVSWMVPWFALQFVASPASMALHVTGHQRRAFTMQLLALVVRLGIVLLAAEATPAVIVEAYALSGAVVYLIYLLAIMAAAGVSLRDLLEGSKRSVGITTLWIAAAIGCLVIKSAVGF